MTLLSDNRNYLLSNTAWVLNANLCIMVLGFVAQTIIARYLGPVGVGWYALAIYFPNMAALFLNLGLPFSNIYLVGSGQITPQQSFSNSLGAGLCLSLPVLLLYLALLPWLLPGLLQGMPRILALIGALFLPLNLLITLATSILQAQERLREISLIRIGQVGGYVTLIFLLVICLQWGVGGALWSNLISQLLAAAIVLYLLSRFLTVVPALNLSVLRVQLAYGLKGHLGSIVQFINYRIDILFVTYFLGSREVGLYTLAVALGEALWQVANAAQAALYPHISASQDHVDFTLQIQTGVVAITTLGAIILLILGKSLIVLIFTEAFLESYTAVVYLLPGIIALTFAKVLTADILGRGYPWAGSIAAAVGMVPTLGLNLILVPSLGIKGAALTSSISYILVGAVVSVIFVRRSQISYTKLMATMNPVQWWHLGVSLIRRAVPIS